MAVPAVCSTGRPVEPVACASKVRWQLDRDHSLEPLAPSDESTEANRDRLDLDNPFMPWLPRAKAAVRLRWSRARQSKTPSITSYAAPRPSLPIPSTGSGQALGLVVEGADALTDPAPSPQLHARSLHHITQRVT